MLEHSPSWNGGFNRIAILVASSVMLTGCFQAPSEPDQDSHVTTSLARKVETALRGRTDDALTYAGFYANFADRLEARSYATTTEAAAIAGRTADILAVPGLLKEIVNDELNPLIGTPQPLTPELASQAAEKLRELSRACRRAAR